MNLTGLGADESDNVLDGVVATRHVGVHVLHCSVHETLYRGLYESGFQECPRSRQDSQIRNQGISGNPYNLYYGSTGTR